MTNLCELFYWMTERQQIWKRRNRGENPPWTDDEILQEYHFCNVYRRLDAGTQYALEHVLEGPDRDVLFNIVLYRFLNRPESYDMVGFQPADEFDFDEAVRVLESYGARNSVFSSAYRVTTQYWAGESGKIPNIIYGILRDDVYANLDDYTERVMNASDMHSAFQVLNEIRGVGDFLAYELVTDLNYTKLPFTENDFVNVGPGAAAGLEIVFGESGPGYINWLHQNQFDILDEYGIDFPFWHGGDSYALTLRNFEHSLCEYRKYHDIKYEGKQHRSFSPSLSDF